MAGDFVTAVENLVRMAPAEWLMAACAGLRLTPAAATPEYVLQRLPATANADLTYLLAQIVRQAAGMMSWEALGWTLQTTFAAYRHWSAEQHIELLWSGPAPIDQIPARRIDQALYDLITHARTDILLVTFAAAKISRLTSALLEAAQRRVKIRLVLEF